MPTQPFYPNVLSSHATSSLSAYLLLTYSELPNKPGCMLIVFVFFYLPCSFIQEFRVPNFKAVSSAPINDINVVHYSAYVPKYYVIVTYVYSFFPMLSK